MSDRQKITLALVLSALLHVLVLIFFGVLNLKSPPPKAPAVVAKPTPLEITIASFATPTPRPVAVATPTPTPTPPALVEREVIDSTGLAKAVKHHEKAPLESDQDLAAGSLLPAVGNVPLPSQAGRKLPFQKFENQRYTAGQRPGGAPASPARPPAPQTPHIPQTPQTLAQNQPRPETKPPPPSPVESATPAPTLTPPPPADDQLFALGRPTPVPMPNRLPRTLEQLRKELAMLKPTAPSLPPQPAAQAPGYQPQSEKTEVAGGISNRGETGVDAAATVKGRYEKTIFNIVGSRWNAYATAKVDVISLGEVFVHFKIDLSGRPFDIRVIHNTSNETLASITVQAISESKFPPIPEELIPLMQAGGYDVDRSYILYAQ